MNPSIMFGLAAGTLVSEDLTSISAGLLAREGVLDLLPAIAACTAGVYVGDLGLWALGRVVGRRALRWNWIARRVNPTMLANLGVRLDGRMGLAVLASRFLPGSRLPMYLALGISGRRPLAFVAWSFLAVVLWTPALVWLTCVFGSSISTHLLGDLNAGFRYLFSVMVVGAVWRLTVRLAFRAVPSRG
jgi:membrane protein DedA with SNARE-associated domain